MTPAAILFDFGGTLDADGIAWKERFQALFAQGGWMFPGDNSIGPSTADDSLSARCRRISS